MDKSAEGQGCEGSHNSHSLECLRAVILTFCSSRLLRREIVAAHTPLQGTRGMKSSILLHWRIVFSAAFETHKSRKSIHQYR